MRIFVLVLFLIISNQCLAASQYYGAAGSARLVNFLEQNSVTLGQTDKAVSGRNPTYLETKPSLTSGREFMPNANWNVWATVNYYDLRDQRYELDLKGNSAVFILGLDKKINEKFVAGIKLYSLNFKANNFGGNWNSKTNGWATGPYFGYRVSKHWALNFDLTYGQASNSNSIVVLNGDYRSSSYSGQVGARGKYQLGDINILPQPSIFYSRIYNHAYQVTGRFAGTDINLAVPSADFGVGIADFALEVNKDFKLAYFKILEPYVEAGVQYGFERPNNGQILTGNLLLVATTPWNGTVRLGTRLLVTDSVFIEGSAGYLSLGHPDLNIWEAKLYLSCSF